jgi:hypothetical protein
LACGASQSGFGQTYSAVAYCTTAKTSPFTAAAGTGYFINTTCGAVTVTLPASPTAGDVVAFKDYAGQWNTNAVTLCNNGNKINGVCSTATLNTNSQSVTLIYVDATKGWQDIQDSSAAIEGGSFITATGGTIVTCGDYKTHIFTSTGTFCVSAGGGVKASVDYFVVAGGGGGGTNGYGGAGGGAGGFRVSNSYLIPAPTMSPLSNPATISSLTPGSYPVTVGAGGAGVSTPPTLTGLNGSDSVFSTITSAGGGGGGGAAPSFPLAFGLPGGSGGGSSPACASGGTGNTPPVSPPQGQNGGQGAGSGTRGGGGGGGAGAVGSNASSPSAAGPGGIGSYIADAFIGPTAPSYGEAGPVSSTRYFAGGGGGSNETPPGTKGTGGIGGGGDGWQNASGPGCAGVANTGGGGGGSGSPYAGATGGSGIVMIRYKFQ